MSGYPLQAPIFTGWDDLGRPVAGGKLWSWIAGTATPAPTYADEGLTVLNTNPVILDAAGRAVVFIPSAAVREYKFSLTTAADVPIWGPIDGISVPAIAAPAPAAPLPPGTILAYGGASAPAGYLLCDGAAVSRNTYKPLWDAIGAAYGAGNGTTTFNVPDLRGKFPLGVAVSGTANALGASGGTLDHLHTGPSHTHTVAAHAHTIAHTHSVPRDGWSFIQNSPAVTGRLRTGDAAGAGSEASAAQATGDNTSGASSAANSGTQALTSDAAGTGNTGTANPPYLALSFIIAT